MKGNPGSGENGKRVTLSLRQDFVHSGKKDQSGWEKSGQRSWAGNSGEEIEE